MQRISKLNPLARALLVNKPSRGLERLQQARDPSSTRKSFSRVLTMDRRTHATVLMSGGINSAACAHFLRRQGFVVDAIFLDYGQLAATLKAAMAFAHHLDLPMQRSLFPGPSRRGGARTI